MFGSTSPASIASQPGASVTTCAGTEAGGALGTVYVTSAVVLTPQIGAAAVMGLAVTGQLLAGLVVDKTGFLGAPMHEITLGRIGGAVLLVAGAVMIRLL